MKIELTKKQKEHYKSVEWLLNDESYRREGRSYLMAVCFIQRALRNRGCWVKVFDHFSRHPMTTRFLLDTVVEIVKNDEGIYEKLEVRQSGFEFRIK